MLKEFLRFLNDDLGSQFLYSLLNSSQFFCGESVETKQAYTKIEQMFVI